MTPEHARTVTELTRGPGRRAWLVTHDNGPTLVAAGGAALHPWLAAVSWTSCRGRLSAHVINNHHLDDDTVQMMTDNPYIIHNSTDPRRRTEWALHHIDHRIAAHHQEDAEEQHRLETATNGDDTEWRAAARHGANYAITGQLLSYQPNGWKNRSGPQDLLDVSTDAPRIAYEALTAAVNTVANSHHGHELINELIPRTRFVDLDRLQHRLHTLDDTINDHERALATATPDEQARITRDLNTAVARRATITQELNAELQHHT